MNTLLLDQSDHDIARACRILQQGGLVAFPTETVYGLGANALSTEAVARIFRAKGRPADNPLIVHIAKTEQLSGLVTDVPARARLLMERFWPGPLTIVLPKSGRVPDAVSAGLDTVAVRMPSHPAAVRLLSACGLPVAAPSANTSGKPSPTTAQHVLDDLQGKIEAVLDGGSCSVGVESTVVDLTGEMPLLLRPGGITHEELERVLGEVRLNFEYKEGETPRSPGVKYKHYAPRAEVYIVRGSLAAYVARHAAAYRRVGVLCKTPAVFPKNCIVRSMGSAPAEYAQTLFASLRAFDGDGVDVIFAEELDGAGLNLATRNRLYKAAGYKFAEE